MAITDLQREHIIALTTIMFGAPPGATYLKEFEDYLESGGSLADLAQNLAQSPVFAEQFASSPTLDAKIEQTLDRLGLTKNSTAYTVAKQFFQARLADGADPGLVLLEAGEFLYTTEAPEFAQAAQQFQNQTQLGFHHSVVLGVDVTDLAELRSVFDGVTSDPTSVDNVKEELDSKYSEPAPAPAPEPGPGPGPGPQPSPTFMVTEADDVYSFGGTATGDITLAIDGENVVTFTRGGVDAEVTIDLDDWVGGTNYLVLDGERLVLTPDQAHAFTEAATSAMTTYTAITGDGSVEIDTSTISNTTNLFAISSSLQISFANSDTVTVEPGAVLYIHPHHADNLIIDGDGQVQVALHNFDTGPVTLDIRTEADGNYIGGTGQDDVISISGSGTNTVRAGYGSDQITLGDGTDTIVLAFGSSHVIFPSDTAANGQTPAFTTYAGAVPLASAGDSLNFNFKGEFKSVTLSGATLEAIQADLDALLGANQVAVSFSSNDLILSSVGVGDTLTGAAFSDGEQFARSDSYVGAYDVIQNFTVGTDKFDLLTASGTPLNAPTSLERFADVDGAFVTSGQNLIDEVWNSDSFLSLDANQAGIIVVTSGDYAGAYLYVNDDIGALDSGSDVFIKLVGTTDLGAVGSLTASIGDYFA